MNIAVCEDEPVWRRIVSEKIQEYIGKTGMQAELRTFSSGRGFLCCGQDFDIVFMDIELGGENGMEVIDEYRQKSRSVNIFLTSHGEEIANGYKVKAFRFLLKPLDDELFSEAMGSALRELASRRKLIGYQEGKQSVIFEDDIIYIEAGDKASGIRTKNGFYMTRLMIGEMMERIDPQNFYMPHRSYIVNLNYIEKVDKCEIILCNGEKIRVSRLKQKEFQERFYDHIRRGSAYVR